MAGPPTDVPSERVAIVGDGQMALALADLLAWKGMVPLLWSPFPNDAAQLRRTRASVRLPEFRLDDAVVVEGDDGHCLGDATLLVNAIPTQFMRATWDRLAPHVEKGGAPVVSVAKGIELSRHKRPSEILAESLGERVGVVALSGPTIATELVRHLPAVLVAASTDAALAARVASLFASPWTRIYSHGDVLGVELAGALKNVIAIAAGIIDGARLGTNAKSALLARGLAEIVRFGAAMGARPETFFGVAGVGDLATTCFSPEGRNRSFGEAIARGGAARELLEHGTCVVEGAPTAKAVRQIAIERGIDMPITDAVYAIVFEGRAPSDALAELMRRTAGAERIG
ncbi:MAG: NAD(P)H-dependent glycerol-3-phosphate dehydrogenase [Phycisphaerales bacterium]